jgi:hypothetical protein
MKFTSYLRGIHGIHLTLIKKKYQKIITCNRLDVKTLGSSLIMPKKISIPLNRENRPLVTNELVEFERKIG